MIPKLLETALRLDEAKALDYLEDHISALGYVPDRAQRWLYSAGTIPICLVAHIDTVHNGAPVDIYHDTAKGIVWSPDGLGADDRAGVWGILELLRRGLRPHVLFTDEEETGGRGASEAARELLPDVRFLVQMDRAGDRDSVTYSCDNRKAIRWVNRFGFETASGSFTDISILMPQWGIAGVNLSIGYYQQHSTGEYLSVPEALATIGKVEKMLQAPPRKCFRYHQRAEKLSSWAGWQKFFPVVGKHDADLALNDDIALPTDAESWDRCDGCDDYFYAEDLQTAGTAILCSACVKVYGKEGSTNGAY